MNSLPRVPGINRAKLIAMGLGKIQHACQVHYLALMKCDPKDPRARIHRGLLAQCNAAIPRGKSVVVHVPCASFTPLSK